LAERPFVGTRVDGTPEIIRHGKNGYLVEPKDPEALAGAMEQALRLRPVDPEDRRLVQAWDAKTMVREQEQLYEELVRAR
jgi:glycosyltransferase involved in cell wall biosynthesis